MSPIGNSLNWTPPQIAAESQITPSDISAAVALWKRYAPTRYRDLIAGGGVLYGWDKTRRVYFRESNGEVIDPLTLRNIAIDPFLFNVRLAMRDTSTRLQQHKITLAEWQLEMTELVKNSQIAAALVADGGEPNATNNDYAVIVLLILAMLGFLSAFAKDIETGKQPLNGLLLSRSDLYAFAGRDAYEEARRQGLIEEGEMIEERRVLDPGANHCHTQDEWIGCPELAELGWQPIGSLPRLYDTPCRTNCKCHFEYR